MVGATPYDPGEYPGDMDAGILPVKGLDTAKQRLGEQLDDAQRREVALALAEDAMRLARESSFLTWWVVSDDDEIHDMARSYGLNGVKDQQEGLNPAVRQAVEVVVREGATSVTIVPSDVPLAYSGDVRDLVDTGATSEIVLVPSAKDGGTNALYIRPPDLIVPRFGEASMQAHLALAERLGHRCSILVLPRLALDIDTIDDVDEFLAKDTVGRSSTAAVLKKIRGKASPDGNGPA